MLFIMVELILEVIIVNYLGKMKHLIFWLVWFLMQFMIR